MPGMSKAYHARSEACVLLIAGRHLMHIYTYAEYDTRLAIQNGEDWPGTNYIQIVATDEEVQRWRLLTEQYQQMQYELQARRLASTENESVK